MAIRVNLDVMLAKRVIAVTIVGGIALLALIACAAIGGRRDEIGILAAFLNREIAVEGFLERSLAIQVEEIIVVQCTEEDPWRAVG